MGDIVSNRVGALLAALLGGSIVGTRRGTSPALLPSAPESGRSRESRVIRRGSWHKAHQGDEEMARRRRQIAAGILTRSNGLQA